MTSGLYPLLDWLRERVAERESLARDAMAEDSASWTTRHGTADSGLSEVLDSVRYAVASEITHGTAEHIALHDPADALAQCEAHTALLDLIEKTSGPDIAIKSEHDEDIIGAMFVALKMDEFALAVARAYQHHPEYADQLAAFEAQPHQVRITRARDELAERRNPPSPR